jgi:hypothetical protein
MELVGAPEEVLERGGRASEGEQRLERADVVGAREARPLAAERAVGQPREPLGIELALPALEADAWLIGRMVANAVLEIAFLDAPTPERAALVEELSRLTFRMLRARDIDAPP